jgi:hypothetical protein
MGPKRILHRLQGPKRTLYGLQRPKRILHGLQGPKRSFMDYRDQREFFMDYRGKKSESFMDYRDHSLSITGTNENRREKHQGSYCISRGGWSMVIYSEDSGYNLTAPSSPPPNNS